MILWVRARVRVCTYWMKMNEWNKFNVSKLPLENLVLKCLCVCCFIVRCYYTQNFMFFWLNVLWIMRRFTPCRYNKAEQKCVWNWLWIGLFCVYQIFWLGEAFVLETHKWRINFVRFELNYLIRDGKWWCLGKN